MASLPPDPPVGSFLSLCGFILQKSNAMSEQENLGSKRKREFLTL